VCATLGGRGVLMEKILVVEDNEVAALALCRLLKARGYEVASAPDAIMAVECARRLQPDIVLLDISIPGGNGFSVADKIQKLIAKPVHLLFLTASEDPMLKEKALSVGAAEFVQKPYQPAELLEAIRDTLDGLKTGFRKEVYVL